jgi:hypothetical protein
MADAQPWGAVGALLLLGGAIGPLLDIPRIVLGLVITRRPAAGAGRAREDPSPRHGTNATTPQRDASCRHPHRRTRPEVRSSSARVIRVGQPPPRRAA